jgi:hypothetical protein
MLQQLFIKCVKSYYTSKRFIGLFSELMSCGNSLFHFLDFMLYLLFFQTHMIYWKNIKEVDIKWYLSYLPFLYKFVFIT